MTETEVTSDVNAISRIYQSIRKVWISYIFTDLFFRIALSASSGQNKKANYKLTVTHKWRILMIFIWQLYFQLLISRFFPQLLPSERTRKFLKQQNRVYNDYTLERLQNEFQLIDWEKLILGLMEIGKSKNSSKGRRLDWSQLLIYVPYPDYLRRLFATIRNEDKRFLVCYGTSSEIRVPQCRNPATSWISRNGLALHHPSIH